MITSTGKELLVDTSETVNYVRLWARSAPDPVDFSTVWTPPRYDFTAGIPDPNLLPLSDLEQAASEALRQEGKDLAHYPPGQGHPGLQDIVAKKFSVDQGISTPADRVLITNGAMHAISLVAEVLLDPGDLVVTEEFTFAWSLRVFERFGARPFTVETDENGMVPEALDHALGALRQKRLRPKIIYTIPTFHNPLGLEVPLERRQQILDVASRHGVPILEDDVYGDLRFEGEPIPAIAALDRGKGNVLYVGSFSKIVAPGMRLGYLLAPPQVMGRLLACKLDAGTSAFSSMILYHYLKNQRGDHLEEVRLALRAKRDALLGALEEGLGNRARWSHPRGGMFLWLRLPQWVNTYTLRDKAENVGVSYVPGIYFSPYGKGENCLRLSFGYASRDDIHEGIKKLTDVLRAEGVLKSPTTPSRSKK